LYFTELLFFDSFFQSGAFFYISTGRPSMKRFTSFRTLCHGRSNLKTSKTFREKMANAAAGADPDPALIPPPCFTANAGADTVARAVDAYVAALLLRTLLRPESAEKVAKLVADDAASNSGETNPMATEKVLRRCFDETVMNL
jgi:alcohol dehydrogenase class IV